VADLQVSFFMLLSGIMYRNFYIVEVYAAGVEKSVNYAEVEEVIIQIILMVFAIKYFRRMRNGQALTP